MRTEQKTLASKPAPQPKTPAAPINFTARFETLLGKTLPSWAGGITLAIAGVLIVRYAIDIGFFARVFTTGVQVIAGILFGPGLLGGAEYAWRNEDRQIGRAHVRTPVPNAQLACRSPTETK